MAIASLFALLDDIASVLDDVALMTKVAAKKTVGVVGDDLAVNADQVTGVQPDRELPIVWAVAKGSLVNKAVLIPLALLMSVFVPAWITPLLMLGGAYLCFEGMEKVLHLFARHDEDEAATVVSDVLNSEKDKIKGAVRTDFILSAEIIILAMNEVQHVALITKILALCAVGVLITLGVYGLVGVIVKMDDVGFYLMRTGSRLKYWLGRALIAFMPLFMRLLSVAGTIAMFMVGGGIWVHHAAWLHPFHWSSTWANLGFSVGVGVMIGLLVCTVLAAAKKLFHKTH